MSRAPSHESQHIEANLTFLYRSSAASSLRLSSASGQLVHLVVQKSRLFWCSGLLKYYGACDMMCMASK